MKIRFRSVTAIVLSTVVAAGVHSGGITWMSQPEQVQVHNAQLTAVAVEATTKVGPATVPDVVGTSLEYAISELTSAGLKSKAKDLSLAKRKVAFPEQWIVAGQMPRPGGQLSPSTPVRLEVLKRDEFISYVQDNEYLTLPADHVVKYEDAIMLDFVGRPLDEAIDAAKKAGLKIVERSDASAKKRAVWLTSNWVVVQQNFAPGTLRETRVEVKVLKKSEATKVHSSPSQMDPHVYESRFAGTITGYDERDENIVVVDAAPVRLDLIGQYGDACNDRIDGADEAVKARNELLPIGRKVVVTLSRPGLSEDEAFVHLAGEFDSLTPSANSVNEQLVATGYWVPDSIAFDDSALARGDATSYDTHYLDRLSPVQQLFAQNILLAGISTRAASIGGVADCVTQAAEYQAEMGRIRELVEESIRQGEAEYQRKRAAGFYWCRDGDGDGVCNER